MSHRNYMKSAIAMAILALTSAAFAQDAVQGVVYHDSNGDGVRDNGEAGIEGVGVSNGNDVVLTDSEGAYELPFGCTATGKRVWTARLHTYKQQVHYQSAKHHLLI